ncbi:hypothetical protein CBER1_11766 [Cercospora berteroae]|uniref:Uncharacterized protein n=1 Tax=Cercospora berteroae TaxID=357750 RepID=A0A2S6CIM3_9PEZI|nr:hypothetical protein CBER1_11766 [Cercospora berteroae]
MARLRTSSATSANTRSRTKSVPTPVQSNGPEGEKQTQQHDQEHEEEMQTRVTDSEIRATLRRAAEYAESEPSTALAMYHVLYLRCLDSTRATTTRLTAFLHQQLLPENRTMHSTLQGILDSMLRKSKDNRTPNNWKSLQASAWGESLDLVSMWAHFTVDGKTLPPGRFIGGLCDLSGGETDLEAGLELLEKARLARLESRELRARHDRRAQPRGREYRWKTQDINLAIELWVEQDPAHRSADRLTNCRGEQTQEQKRAAAAKLKAKRAQGNKTVGLRTQEGDHGYDAPPAARDGGDTESNSSAHDRYAQREGVVDAMRLAGSHSPIPRTMADVLNQDEEAHGRRSGLHGGNIDNDGGGGDDTTEWSIELGRNRADSVVGDVHSPSMGPAFSPLSDTKSTILEPFNDDDEDDNGTLLDSGNDTAAEHGYSHDEAGLTGGEDSISELPSLVSPKPRARAHSRLPQIMHMHYHLHLEHHHTPPRRRPPSPSPCRSTSPRSAPAAPSPRTKAPPVAAETRPAPSATTVTSAVPSATSQTPPTHPMAPNMLASSSESSHKRQRTGGREPCVMQDMSLTNWLGIFHPAKSALRSLPTGLDNAQVRASAATGQQCIAVLEQPASPEDAGGLYMVVVAAEAHTTLFAPFVDSPGREGACPIPVSEVRSVIQWPARNSVVKDEMEGQPGGNTGPAELARGAAGADEVTALAIGAAFLSSGRPIPPIDPGVLDVWRYSICLTSSDKPTDLRIPFLDAGPTTPLIGPSISGIGRDYAADVDTLKQHCCHVERLRKAQKEANLIRTLLVQAARDEPAADIATSKDVQGLEEWCRMLSDILSKTSPGTHTWHSQQTSLELAQRDLDAARAKLAKTSNTIGMRKHIMDMLAVLSASYDDEMGKFGDCVAGFLHGLDKFAKECKDIAEVCSPGS